MALLPVLSSRDLDQAARLVVALLVATQFGRAAALRDVAWRMAEIGASAEEVLAALGRLEARRVLVRSTAGWTPAPIPPTYRAVEAYAVNSRLHRPAPAQE